MLVPRQNLNPALFDVKAQLVTHFSYALRECDVFYFCTRPIELFGGTAPAWKTIWPTTCVSTLAIKDIQKGKGMTAILLRPWNLFHFLYCLASSAKGYASPVAATRTA
jgi:hypothetical protein